MKSYKIKDNLITWNDHKVYTWHLQPAKPRQGMPVVVMLHGAGTADSSRAKGLAEAFADYGVSTISLDFVGHGKSSGDMQDMSLKRRTDLAESVINYWTEKSDTLALCGFSMSGHTALRLTGRLGDRVQALSLMAPGVYAAEAEEVLFTDDFSAIIRKENSWQNSLALRNAEEYKGRVYMLMSAHDEVIPWGVAEHLLRAFKRNASEVRFDILKEPDHKVAVWLSAHPERGHNIIRYLTAAEHRES